MKSILSIWNAAMEQNYVLRPVAEDGFCLFTALWVANEAFCEANFRSYWHYVKAAWQYGLQSNPDALTDIQKEELILCIDILEQALNVEGHKAKPDFNWYVLNL